MVIASVTGVFKMILMIIGVLVLLRFIGQFLIAKRNLEEERRIIRKQRETDNLLYRTKKNYGKTHILSIRKGEKTKKKSTAEDVDFVEISEQ